MGTIYQLGKHRWFERPDLISLLFLKPTFNFSLFSYASKPIYCLVANKITFIHLKINNAVKLLRLTQSLWERYFYYFDNFWCTCQLFIKFLAPLPGTVDYFNKAISLLLYDFCKKKILSKKILFSCFSIHYLFCIVQCY